ncbi:ATP-binding protein [Oceaniserpentilla sp. 4NH20-0058]|uniref:GAF domain-containing sensor histidine kinase n=1 Tax=Oceaniserpentilla sp. 4NH20-0058 TaxID=3127660 RepID=UPI00333FCA2D
MEIILRDIIEGVSNNYGKAFFDTITERMHEAIHADFTFIARLDVDANVSRTIALVGKDGLQENFEYSLSDTPCANVADDSVCLYPNHIVQLFPKDQLLIDMGIQGYIGAPLHDSQGKVMGLTVALFQQKIENADTIETIFQIFSGRIAAEIERMEYAQSLEEKVQLRTQHLEDALRSLKQTQNQLIQQEKLASLGGVVAGVAHEINTPLGIAKTGNSFHQDELKKLKIGFDKKELKATDMTHYLNCAEEALTAVGLNLERAIDLVQNFKYAAVERIDGSKNEYILTDFMQHLLVPLSGELERNNIAIQVDVPVGLTIVTFGSELSQVIHNLIINASVHAFEGIESPNLTLSVSVQDEKIVIEIQDNGVGVEPTIRDKVFEPFITTKRGAGSTGLGMNIVHNIVTNHLQGSINLKPTPSGTTWQIILPQLLQA